MNRSELTACIAAQTGESKDTVNNVLGTFYDVVKLRVSQGHLVSARGFGTFLQKKQAQKVGRLMSEGNKPIIIPARIKPNFIPSKEFFKLF